LRCRESRRCPRGRFALGVRGMQRGEGERGGSE
jgi:hypothetical protein